MTVFLGSPLSTRSTGCTRQAFSEKTRADFSALHEETPPCTAWKLHNFLAISMQFSYRIFIMFKPMNTRNYYMRYAWLRLLVGTGYPVHWQATVCYEGDTVEFPNCFSRHAILKQWHKRKVPSILDLSTRSSFHPKMPVHRVKKNRPVPDFIYITPVTRVSAFLFEPQSQPLLITMSEGWSA